MIKPLKTYMLNLFKKKETFKLSFKESADIATITCDHVINKQRPILLVSHEVEDETWMFMCGKDDHKADNYKLVSLSTIVAIDNSVTELGEMPLGYCTERETVNQSWNGYTISK